MEIPVPVPTAFRVLALSSVLLLAACGDSGSGGDSDDAPDAASTDEAPATDAAAPKAGDGEGDTDVPRGPAAEVAAAAGIGDIHPDAEGWNDAQNAFMEGYTALKESQSTGGIQYVVLQSGDGAQPEAGQRVRVHYEGRLTDGTVFDSSYKRGEPAVFPSDRVIVGWQQALAAMQAGDVWEVAIPADLAYGSRGAGSAVPPNAALVFTIELLEVVG